jgi:hypothetical protein
MTVVAIRDADLLYERAFHENWKPVFRFLLALPGGVVAGDQYGAGK